MKKIKTDNVVKFPTSISDGEKEIEAILFASSEPLDEENIETKISKKINVKKALENLKKHYENRGINLICISNKWSFRTSEKLSYLMSKQKTVEKKLSKAAIETLSIIVYHQPVTRAEIEEIRGVAFGTSVESDIFGTGKFYKEKQDNKNEDIYSDIDEMLNSTLKNE